MFHQQGYLLSAVAVAGCTVGRIYLCLQPRRNFPISQKGVSSPFERVPTLSAQSSIGPPPRRLFQLARPSNTASAVTRTPPRLIPTRIVCASKMPPLILHNVPDEELYIGEDGIQRPYAMLYPQ